MEFSAAGVFVKQSAINHKNARNRCVSWAPLGVWSGDKIPLPVICLIYSVETEET